jgi:hypothetical protein
MTTDKMPAKPMCTEICEKRYLLGTVKATLSPLRASYRGKGIRHERDRKH